MCNLSLLLETINLIYMSNKKSTMTQMGKIKFFSDKIITTKNGVVETWVKVGGDENKFIVYQQQRFKLSKSKGVDLDQVEFE